MTQAEVEELLAAQRKVQLATNGPDGFPHLVTMYYVLIDGQITFWTYRRSQKALNLERDPRICCLVETGEQYFDLRGVLVQGIGQADRGPGRGRRDRPTDHCRDRRPDGRRRRRRARDYVEHAARKRYGYAVEPAKAIPALLRARVQLRIRDHWHTELRPADRERPRQLGHHVGAQLRSFGHRSRSPHRDDVQRRAVRRGGGARRLRADRPHAHPARHRQHGAARPDDRATPPGSRRADTVVRRPPHRAGAGSRVVEC